MEDKTNFSESLFVRIESISRLAKLSTFLGLKSDAKMEWTQDSLRNYVEAVKAARSIVSGGLVGLAVLQLTTLLVVGLWHGVSSLQPWAPEVWAWVEICICGGLLIILFLISCHFLSQKFWIRAFKVDQALDSLSDKDKSF